MVENPRMAASQGAPLWDFWKPCLAEFCTVCCQLSSREAHRGLALQRFDPCHRTLQFTRAGSYYSRSARLLIFLNIADHRDRLRPCSAADLAALQYNRERFRGSWRHRCCIFRWWETVIHSSCLLLMGCTAVVSKRQQMDKGLRIGRWGQLQGCNLIL